MRRATDDNSALPFDMGATLALRRAGALAAKGLVNVEHLRQALSEPVADGLPAGIIRLDPAVQQIIERARALAGEEDAPNVSRERLSEALAEADARAAGLELSRLRFERWRVARLYPVAPRLRQHSDLPLALVPISEEVRK